MLENTASIAGHRAFGLQYQERDIVSDEVQLLTLKGMSVIPKHSLRMIDPGRRGNKRREGATVDKKRTIVPLSR